MSCAGGRWSIGEVDLRLEVAGTRRTQRVALDEPLRVSCKPAHRR